MSCENCEDAQENRHTSYELMGFVPPQIFVRVGNANIEIVACETHAKELIEKLRKS